ncbi:hypothetical protein OG234_13380 [Streptomyces sp. NBC_01420]|uniref:hypothetical protein n=1 Tax=Streptomyces sp. NBC_01420 TaxID=2903858 RepID=UPI003251B702
MQLLTPHGVAALLITEDEGQEPALLRYSTATDLDELTALIAEFRDTYADRTDVRLDVTS